MPTIAELIDPFLADAEYRLRMSPNTLRAYRSDLRLVSYALPHPLEQIGRAELEGFLSRIEAPSTRSRRTAALKRFFTWAVRQELLDHDPTSTLEPVRAKRRLPRPVKGRSDRSALDKAIAGAPQPHRLVLAILRETGMRASEVLGLNVGDVCLDGVMVFFSGRVPVELKSVKEVFRAPGRHLSRALSSSAQFNPNGPRLFVAES